MDRGGMGFTHMNVKVTIIACAKCKSATFQNIMTTHEDT